MDNYMTFLNAVPVWIHGREKEMNLTCGFTATFHSANGSSYILAVTASCLYRAYVNGTLTGYGPARAAHDFYRVDEWDITPFLNAGENAVYIEVAGYNTNSFYTLNQPSFLQAEIFCKGNSIAATTPKGDFHCYAITERIQKVQRYSFQRPFVEVWNIHEDYYKRYLEKLNEYEPLTQQPPKQLLPRIVPLTKFEQKYALCIINRGSVSIGNKRKHYHNDRSLTYIDDKLRGFKQDELDFCLSYFTQELDFINNESMDMNIGSETTISLASNTFVTYAFERDFSGFITLNVTCTEEITLCLLFDEALINGDVSFLRFDECVNAVRYDLKPGNYRLQTFECYVLKYLKIISLGGECSVTEVHLREYAAPVSQNTTCPVGDDRMQEIYAAALCCYRSNSVDIFYDDPSRERAGWLYDSFFTARAEYPLTGKCLVEHNYLQNYLIADHFDNIPKRMIPGSYPADHYDGLFIPTHALWLIIQLQEYLQRSGDRAMIDAFAPRLYQLIQYYDDFVNEDGLLEGLQGWIFLEWGRPNELVHDVNYPINMLFSAALGIMGDFYHDPALIKRAQMIRHTVMVKSYDGEFFVDNAVRVDGQLKSTGERTEFCQYYAFFFNFATPDSHPELWKLLVEEFGPKREQTNKYPEIAACNVLFGYHLRLDLLSRYGNHTQMLTDIDRYFYNMAMTTGTLWEHKTLSASLNQAANAHLIYLLQK